MAHFLSIITVIVHFNHRSESKGTGIYESTVTDGVVKFNKTGYSESSMSHVSQCVNYLHTFLSFK